MTELELILDAAREAGELALTARAGGLKIWSKEGGSPVTDADLAVDALLKDRLMAARPDYGWLSEETADSAHRLAHDRVWVVDPIDGTRDYIRGREGWSVSIALVENGLPRIAVLDAPARRERWWAIAGGGVWRNGVPLRVGDRDLLPGARVPTDALPKADRDLTIVDKPNSIALRIAMVAADEADLVATLRWGSEWDIAAAVLIASEAGAAVSDAFGAPLRFNKPDPQAFGVLACTPGIHAAAVARLADRAAHLSAA